MCSSDLANGEATFAKLASDHTQLGRDGSSKTALLALGNPANVKHPVHTPQVRGHSIEKETYRWFVENDNDAVGATHQWLTDINAAEGELPSLIRTRSKT